MKCKKLLTALFPVMVFLLLMAVGGYFYGANVFAATITNFTVTPTTSPSSEYIGQGTTSSWMFSFTVPTLMYSDTTSTPLQHRGVEITWPNYGAGQQPYNNFVFGSNVNTYTTVSTSTDASLIVTASSTITWAGTQTPTRRMLIDMTTSTPAKTYVTLQVDGLTNPFGASSSSLSSMVWGIKTGKITFAGDDSFIADADKIDNGTSAAYTHLGRAGGPIISNSSSTIVASSYVAGATNVVYTLSFTPTTALPPSSTINIVFPTTFNLQNVATTTADGGAGCTGGLNNAGTTCIKTIATSTMATQGSPTPTVKRIRLVTAGAETTAGQTLIVVLSGIGNPASNGVQRGIYVYTTRSDGALIDGSPDSYDTQNDYTNQPPPADTVHIGGNNSLVFTVYKILASGATTTLTAGERAQVKVNVSCPDKQFFVGSKYPDFSGQVIFKHVLDCNYVAEVMPAESTSFAFWQRFVQPAPLMISATAGDTAATTTASVAFKVADGEINGVITGGINDYSGQDVFIRAYDPNGFQSMAPIWNKPTTSTEFTGGTADWGLSANGTGFYTIPATKNATWKVTFPQSSLTSGEVTKWTPVLPDQVMSTIASSTIAKSAFLLADKVLTVKLYKEDGTTKISSGACVSVKRAGAGMMMGKMNAICAENGSGENDGFYQFQVPAGDMVVQVMQNGKPSEYPVSVTASVAKTIIISAPTTSITVNVTDGTNNINGVPVMARAENGFGFANAMTNASGVATLYVPSGSAYEVSGFSSFGRLGPTAGVAVGGTVNYTISTASLGLISGHVTASSTAATGVSGVSIGVHNATSGNGTVTDSNGEYKMYVPAGTYTIGGFSPSYGGLGEQSVTVAAGGTASKNWELEGQGTIQVTVTNGANFCYTTSGVEKCKMMAGAFNATTNRGNFVDSWRASSNDRIATINVPAGSYTVNVNSFNGLLKTEAVTVESGATTAVAVTAPTLVAVSGTITSGGDNLANVWLNQEGQGGVSVTTGSNGAYSIKVPAGTYQMAVTKVGYMPQTFSGFSYTSASSTSITLTAAEATITGTIIGPSEGYVMAQNTADSKMWTGTPLQSNGTYSLSVEAGSTWTVFAEGPCYTKSSGLAAAADESGKNITLTAIAGCSTKAPVGQSMIPSSGGQMSNGTKATLDIPANALGNGTSAVSVSVSDPDYVNIPSGATMRPLSNSVQKIVATDGTSNITDLSGSVTITLTYNEADLPTGFDESTLRAGYWDATNVRWEPIESTVNTTANTITFTTSHFTEFGPLLPGVPDQVTGLTASTVSDVALSLNWTAVTGATSYVVYRSLTDSGFSTSVATPTTNSYTDTGRTAATKYYYEVAAVNENGEGLNSSSANATTQNTIVSSGGGGGGSVVQTQIPSSVSVKINSGVAEAVSQDVGLTLSALNASQMAISNSADFSGASFEPYATSKSWKLTSGAGAKTVYVKFKSLSGGEATALASIALKGTAIAVAPILGEQPAPAVGTGAIPEAKNLKFSLPAALQVRLGKSLGYGYQFTNATGKTLKIKLQRTVTDPNGKVILDVTGTRTLAKGKAVSLSLKAAVAKNAPVGIYTVSVKVSNLADSALLDQGSFTYEVAAVEAAAPAPSAGALTRKLYRGMSGNDVRALQTFLAKDSELYPEGKVTGFYGALTAEAMKRFQTRHGIDIVGWVGPKSLLKLQELMAE